METQQEESVDSNLDNLDDYLKHFKLDEWPVTPNDIVLPDYNIDNFLGTQEQIYKEFHDALFSENETVNKINYRLKDIEAILNEYRGYLFTDEKRFSRIKNNMFYAPSRFFLTESEIALKELTNERMMPSSHRRRKNLLKDAHKKTVDNVIYQCFNNNELTDLPGFLESPHLLNAVTEAFDFKPSFLRFWKPVIRSEASNAILLDSFWWFYLHFFKKDESLNKDKVLHFSRISDSFVALFTTVDTSFRDKFFDVYSDFLPQAIYLTFFQAFPDSRLHLNDDFKQEICNIVSEWILGIKPVPETYRNWKIKVDTNLTVSRTAEGKQSSPLDILQKIANLEKMLKNLGNKENPDMQNVQISKKNNVQIAGVAASQKYLNSIYRNKLKDSHAVGEGAVVEKVLFNSKGQSMLVSHYLSMHNLQEAEPKGQMMVRTQIVHQPPANAKTYRDLIFDTIERSKTLDSEFHKVIKSGREDMKSARRSLKNRSPEKQKTDNREPRLSHRAFSAPADDKIYLGDHAI